MRPVGRRWAGQEESPVGNAVGLVAGMVVTIERCVASPQSEGFLEDGSVCRSRSELEQSEMTGTVGEGSTTASSLPGPVAAMYMGSVSTGRVGEWFVAGDGLKSHAIEADMFVDLEQDFERVGGERDEEVEDRGQEWQSVWTSTGAGSEAGMVIGLSCRTKIRLVNDEVVEAVETASPHIHLGTKRATLPLRAD